MTMSDLEHGGMAWALLWWTPEDHVFYIPAKMTWITFSCSLFHKVLPLNHNLKKVGISNADKTRCVWEDHSTNMRLANILRKDLSSEGVTAKRKTDWFLCHGLTNLNSL